jgi:hypothetical protein
MSTPYKTSRFEKLSQSWTYKIGAHSINLGLIRNWPIEKNQV